MAKLDDLPCDVLQHLLEQVIQCTDLIKTLPALACVNKCIHDALEPLLFRDVSLQTTKHLCPLTFHVLQHPELAERTRSLYVGGFGDADQRQILRGALASSEVLSVVDEDDWAWQRYLSRVVDPRLSNRRGWPERHDLGCILRDNIIKISPRKDDAAKWYFIARNAQSQRNNDAVLALLLTKLLNLRTLEVTGMQGSPQKYLSQTMQLSAAPRAGRLDILSSLEDLRFGGTHSLPPTVSHNSAALAFRLPSMRSISLDTMSIATEALHSSAEPRLNISPYESPINVVRISGIALCEALKTLVQAPRALTDFEYHVHCPPNCCDGRRAAFDSDDVLVSLRAQKENLRSILVTYPSWRRDLGVPTISASLALLNFSDFRALRHLSTDPIFLVGLPSSLVDSIRARHGGQLQQFVPQYGLTPQLTPTDGNIVDNLPPSIEALHLYNFDADPAVAKRASVAVLSLLSRDLLRFGELKTISMHFWNDLSDTLETRVRQLHDIAQDANVKMHACLKCRCHTQRWHDSRQDYGHRGAEHLQYGVSYFDQGWVHEETLRDVADEADFDDDDLGV